MSKERLKEYWDKLILKHIPPHAQFGKVEAEIKEHYASVKWWWKRFLLPLIIFFIVMGLIFRINVLGSLIISLIVFLYSNLLPDADILIKHQPDNNNIESVWYETYFLLCFAPLVLFYAMQGKVNPLRSKTIRPFHNLRSAFVWALFLFFIGYILWPTSMLKTSMLPVFGAAGFIFHLMVDNAVNFWEIKKQVWSKFSKKVGV